MKRTIFIWLLILGLTSMKYAAAQCRLDKSNYQIVIDEQFDNYGGSVTNLTGPNSIWKATSDGLYGGWGTEYYESSQVQLVPDGNGGYRLRLIAEKLQSPFTVNGRVIRYKSGILNLKNSINLPATSLPQPNIPFDPPGASGCYYSNQRGFSYGMFEIRCKTPAGDPNFDDTWPAFWLLSSGAELDIIDSGVKNPGEVYVAAIHDWAQIPSYINTSYWEKVTDCPSCPLWTDKAYSIGDLVRTGEGTFMAIKNMAGHGCYHEFYSNFRNLSNEFTTYTVVWTPDDITVFVEERELYTINKSVANLTNDCPLNIITSFQTLDTDPNNQLPYPQIFNMDVDYIKVYKPKKTNGIYDYGVSYKTNSEYVNHNVFENIPTAVKVSQKANSIATNPNDPNEVFYRGVDNYIYTAKNVNNIWQIKRLEFNNGPAVLAKGDIKYLPVHDALIYVGADNRINWFGRSTTEPCGFSHWHLSSNWNCYACVTGEEIYAEEGSLQVSPNGEVFYRGADNKMHWFYYVNGNWNHQVFFHPNNNTQVTGNIVIDPASNTNQVFYRGVDGRIQNFYKTSATTYAHGWIGSNSFLVDNKPGSMAWAPSLNGILYIGTDNKLHTYYWNINWIHELIPYTYGSPSLGYANGDYLKSGINWEDDGKSLFYIGFDGRMQSLYKYGSAWYHAWIDYNWNNGEFSSFNNQAPSDYSGSVITGWETPDKSIFYTNKDNNLMIFRYGPCTNDLQTCNLSMIKNIFKYASSNSMPKEKVNSELISVYPNPCSDYIILNGLEGTQIEQYEITDLTGRVLLENQIQGGQIDVNKLSPGVYLLNINSNGEWHNFKFYKK